MNAKISQIAFKNHGPFFAYSKNLKNQLASSLSVFSSNHNAGKFILLTCSTCRQHVGFAITGKECINTPVSSFFTMQG